MGNDKKKLFAFSGKEDLSLGSHGKDVQDLQTILTSLGYLRGSYHPGELCPCTQRAVRRYQRYYGLTPDGVVGLQTKSQLERRRCGVPDIPVVRPGHTLSAPFVLRGCSYSSQNLSYAFLNDTSDLPGGQERNIVRQAFDTWQNVANVTFREVEPAENPDFRIAWRTGAHGDGDSFDGPGNVLAHAFFPPPCGGLSAGDLHFDEGETWVNDPSAGGILLLQVAIHEIGHLLGLSHSQDEAAIMFAYYSPDRVSLAQDDIEGVQALYGAPSASTQLQLGAEAGAELDRAAAERHYEIEMPTSLTVTIDGPGEADFDLYLRKGAPPTTDVWDQRAYTVSADEQITFAAEGGAKYFLMVRSYEGAGEFALKVKPGS